jgi:CRISPR-associated protein Cas1
MAGGILLRKLLNTLFVTSPEAYLSRDGENVVVLVSGEPRFRMPVHNLDGIVTFGYTGASPGLMELCANRGVALSFLSQSGRFMARVTGRVSGNVLLRRKQYRVADSEDGSARIASSFVVAKISNCRTVLQRAVRDHEANICAEDVTDASQVLSNHLMSVTEDTPLEMLRGIEGAAANVYFSAFDHLILANKQAFFFKERSRRPPRDNMNALLSFLYTLLVHDVQSALEAVGLDPQVGFLHRDRPGRPGLALDMMEELRPFLADRLALSLVNRKQVSPSGFSILESGAVVMDDKTRKTVISAWQKRKQDKIAHPLLNEKIDIGLIPYAQAMLLARHLRGDLDGYPPFFWK